MPKRPVLDLDTIEQWLPDDQLLTIGESATLLCISIRKLFDLADSGQLPQIRIDGAVRYRVGDLRQFMTSRRVHRLPKTPRRGAGSR